MARVTAYEAADGTLYRDRKAYLQHESNLVVAQKLKPIITGLVQGPDDAARADAATKIHDFIVKDLGLNTLRELLSFQFKPNADDSENGSPTSTETNAGAAEASGATEAQAAGVPEAAAATGADASAAAAATSDI